VRLRPPRWPSLLPARLVTACATLGPLGRRLPAPGTWGSLAGLACFAIFLPRAGPGLVLADEPTGNLDPETAGRILDLLLAQARDRQAAVLIVTHSEMVAAAADRVLRLSASGLVPA
jgi:putative ABC transport system ATP-binding protein